MPIRNVYVVNRSTLVTDAEVQTMALACGIQADQHVALAWGILPVLVSYLDRASTPLAGSSVITVLDDADQAGDLGYHSEGDGGVTFGRVFARPVFQNGGDVLTDTLSVSSVLSHEVTELMLDPDCNRWCQRADGTLIALEGADPVESSSYSVKVTTPSSSVAVSVSDFVLPAWFDPDAPVTARFDYLGAVTAPFQVQPTGYTIQMAGGTVTEQWGAKYPEWRKQTKLAESARTQRRHRFSSGALISDGIHS